MREHETDHEAFDASTDGGDRPAWCAEVTDVKSADQSLNENGPLKGEPELTKQHWGDHTPEPSQAGSEPISPTNKETHGGDTLRLDGSEDETDSASYYKPPTSDENPWGDAS
jgi:hypothetical protein